MCDLKLSASDFVSRNMKSAGKRMRLRRTCSLRRFVGHVVEICQIYIDHDLVITNQIDSPFDNLHGARETNQFLLGRHS